MSIARGVQSETSMVRALALDGHERLVVGYNDQSGQFSAGALLPEATFMGWAISDDGGSTWARQGQLPGAKFQLLGDPWLASHDKLVLYVNLAQPAGGTTLSPKGVALAVSNDGGAAFGLPQQIITEAGVDGAKIALNRDGTRALVTWLRADTFGFAIVSDFGSDSPAVGAIATIDPALAGSGPYTGGPGRCNTPFPTSHPTPVGGDGQTFYVAGGVTYGLLPLCTRTERYEVYRTRDLGGSWERIMSVVVPETELRLRVESDRARPPVRPALGIVHESDSSDSLVLLATQKLATTEPTVDQVVAVQWRLTNAEFCVSDRGDQQGCDPSLAAAPPFALERSAKLGDAPLLRERPAFFVFQPAFVSGGTLAGDTRASVFWYAQPFYDRAELDDSVRALAIIEGVSSSNGGGSYGPVQSVSVRDDEVPALRFLPMFGSAQSFIPCAVRASSVDQAYFGDYNGGAYATSAPKDQRTVASWTDSRQGCFSTLPGGQTYHHHVMAAVW